MHVVSGAPAGKFGLYPGDSAGVRVTVLMQLLGAQRRVRLNQDAIEPASRGLARPEAVKIAPVVAADSSIASWPRRASGLPARLRLGAPALIQGISFRHNPAGAHLLAAAPRAGPMKIAMRRIAGTVFGRLTEVCGAGRTA